jgi:hypothetical protein
VKMLHQRHTWKISGWYMLLPSMDCFSCHRLHPVFAHY